MSGFQRSAVFLDSASGARCLAVVTQPAQAVRGCLLHLPAFAEEMNKSRRMVALAAQRFAEFGWLTVQVDLAGCGDSSGDWNDYSWAAWLQDIDAAVAYTRSLCPTAPLVLWSLRAGALLTVDWLKLRGEVFPLLLWQPVVNGQQHLTQFLRVRAAADMLEGSAERTDLAQLREQLAAGTTVDIAGYPLNAAVADGLAAARFAVPADFALPVLLAEVVAGGEDGRLSLSPAMRKLVESWPAQQGLTTQAVSGMTFWNTVDITTAPALIDASMNWLQATWGAHG